MNIINIIGILLLSIVINFFIFNNNYRIEKFKNKKINKLCNRINNEILDNMLKQVYILPNIFSIDECNYIINESEKYASKKGWATKRHNNYPTTDNDIKNISNLQYMIENRVYNKIIPKYKKYYNIPSNLLGIDETFIVKYSSNGQDYLEAHEDGSDFSFVIILNNEFQDGGTYFLNIDKKIIGQIGSVIIFCGKNRHMGVKITGGVRYILTGFLSFYKNQYCNNKY